MHIKPKQHCLVRYIYTVFTAWIWDGLGTVPKVDNKYVTLPDAVARVKLSPLIQPTLSL